MKMKWIVICSLLAIVACKKGGGGGWLVGSSGLMAHVDDDGVHDLGTGLAENRTLFAISCRYAGEAWVVGERGTVLVTEDSGKTWSPQAVPTSATLRTVATQASGPVFIGGDGLMLVTRDSGATWAAIPFEGAIRSIATARADSTVLVLADDGAVWAYDGGLLERRGQMGGARSIALSDDGSTAIAAGQGLARSSDGGRTWTSLAIDPSLVFDGVALSEGGDIVAVGTAGTIAKLDANGAASVQHVGTSDLHALHLSELDHTGYTAGEGGQVLVSRDSGTTWSAGPDLGRTVWSVDDIGASRY